MTTTATTQSVTPAGVTDHAPAGVATHCAYCGLQCAMTLNGSSAADLTVTPRRFPTNRGGLCQKGWTSAELLRTPGRLTTPLVRRDGELVPASWDEALDVVADGIVRTQAAYGRDAVAVFGGGGLTNEKAYQLGKFARVALRTSQIDYNGRWCMSSAAAVGVRRGSATMSPPASAARTRWVRKGGIVSAGLAPRSSTACADPMSVTGNGRPRSRPKHRIPAAAAELMHQRPL